jgi:hypothetical protein
MFTENTGMHFLDSGGDYGRNWQHNQGRIFTDQSRAILTGDKYSDHISLNYVRSTFWHLADSLEYVPNLNNSFYAWERAHHEATKYDSWYKTLENWATYKKYAVKSGDNIYNHENVLDQIYQYDILFLDPNDVNQDILQWEYIILQIHGGCDVRGGYTAPKIFRIVEESFWMTEAGEIVCDFDSAHNWQTDDSTHWYYDGTCGLNAGKQLQDYELECLDDKIKCPVPSCEGFLIAR